MAADFSRYSTEELERMLQGGAARPAAAATAPPDLSTFTDEQLEEMLTQTQVGPQQRGDGLAMNTAAGANEAVSWTLGAPVDALTYGVNHGVNAVRRGVNQSAAEAQRLGLPVAPPFKEPNRDTIVNPIGGRQSIRDVQRHVNASPDTVKAATTGEKLAREVGFGAASMLTPDPTGKARVGTSFLSYLGRTAKDVASGVTGTLGSYLAREIAPEPLKPTAALLGGLAGGVAGMAAVEAPQAVSGAARQFYDDNLAPFLSPDAARRGAADRLRKSATSVDDTKDALDVMGPPGPGASPAERQRLSAVPGSEPTTFQASGDMGLGGLEREMATKYPVPFMDRRAEQGAARAGALQNLQPEGAPTALSEHLRAGFRALDDQTQAALDDATRGAQDRAIGLGGTQTPEAYGSAMRGTVQGARERAKVVERQLWHAVDPDGTITISPQTVVTVARQVRANMTASARPPQGEEAAIFGAIDGYGPVISFKELTDVRSRISEAMREELKANGQTASYARLTNLRGSVEDAITTAAEQRAADAPEVAQAVQSFGEHLFRDAAQWSRNSENLRRSENAAFGTGGFSPMARGEGAQGRRPRFAPGDQGISGPPNFDPAAAERLRVASQSTRERAQTFDRGPVGQSLRTEGMQGQYRLSDSAVPAQFFKPGPTGAEGVQSFRRAAGDDDALLILQDYAAMNLRRAASRADGTLDPARVEAWLGQHRDALRAFPELQTRFRDAGAAGNAIAQAAAARREAMQGYETGAVAALMGVNNSDDVVRTIGSVLQGRDRVQQMTQLAQRAGTSPEARQGLRRAVADYVRQRFISNTEAGTTGVNQIQSDAFQGFVRQNRETLGASGLFSDDELNMLQAIADDLHQANRSVTAVRLPGQSNTAQDVAAVGRSPANPLRSFLANGAGTTAGAAVGAAAGWIGGGVGAILGYVGVRGLAAMRDAGINNVDELVRDAMLNPALARALLDMPRPGDSGRWLDNFVSALRPAAVITPTTGYVQAAGAQPIAQQPENMPQLVRATETPNQARARLLRNPTALQPQTGSRAQDLARALSFPTP